MSCTIGHLDADCFYVSCERVRHRFLRGQAVGVLSNQGACVIAKSYELKTRGITTGMPIWDALPLCPEAIFVKRDFEWYEVLSRRMYDVVCRFSPTVEYYSIDEVFFDARTMTHAEALALQDRVLQETGVPASVGVAPSKTLAKLASSSQKPFGCVVAVEPEAVARLLHDRPVDKITGVGRHRPTNLCLTPHLLVQVAARALSQIAVSQSKAHILVNSFGLAVCFSIFLSPSSFPYLLFLSLLPVGR